MNNLSLTQKRDKKSLKRYQPFMMLLAVFMFVGIVGNLNAQTLTATVADVSCSPAPCPIDSDGAIDLTVTGGVPPYSYEWSSTSASPLNPPCESFFDLLAGTGANPVVGPDNTIVEDAVNTQAFNLNGSVLTLNQAVFSGGASIDEEIIDNSQQTGFIGIRTGVDHDQLTGGVSAANMSRTLSFNPPISNLEMLLNDLDNNDVAIVNLSLGGVAVPLTPAEIVSTGSNVTVVGANQFESIVNGGLGPSLNGSVFFNFAGPIDAIEIIYYDDVAGPGVIGSEGGSYTVDFPNQCPQDLTCLPADTYTVVVTDATGSTATASYTVDPFVGVCDPCLVGDLDASALGSPYFYWEDYNGNPLPLPDPCTDTNWANLQLLDGVGANPVPGGVDNTIVEDAINSKFYTIRGATLTVNQCVFSGGATIDEEIINDTQLNGTFALRTGVDHDQLTGGVNGANMSRTFTFDRPVCDLSMFLNDIDGDDVAIVNLFNNGAIVPLTPADYTFTGTNVAVVGSNMFDAQSGFGLNNSADGGVAFEFTNCIDEIQIIYYDDVAGPGVVGSEGGSYSVNFPPECDYPDTQTDLPVGCYTVYVKDTLGVETSDFLCIEGCKDGAIGNYVYLDENGNGIQDLGEAGIAGVTVNLTGDATATVVTDANGGYIFPDLPEGDYTITVDESTLPSGMTQTANPVNPGADMGNQTNGYDITLAAGEENLTGDFGYNLGDATGNTGPASLGDKVWNDADGDGVQDAGEAGIGGVTVTIYTDTNGDGVIDPATDMPFTAAVDQNGATGTGTTTTNPDGTYYFSNLPAGEYAVVVDPASLPGQTQTGDPDEPGTTATNPDNMSDPVVLAPGDNYVNLDFGYNNPAGNDIGNTIYFDADADGTQDPDEPGIPGVTVSLLDANGDVIATTVTDENGEFVFPGLPDGTYTVVVTDTDNVLDDKMNTEDPDGGNDGMSTVVLAGADDLDQDFGYTPEGQEPGEGLIGDVVFIDYNGNGQPDPNEGIEGVVVELIDDRGNVIATTTTDENGAYSFPGLDPTASYSVAVDPSTLPAGLTPSVDPDGGNDNTADTDLSAAPGGIDLTLDFGYEPTTPGSIGSLVWIDSNADGINDGPDGPDGIAGTDDDEPGVEGVTIDLYEDTNGNGVLDAGEPLLASTTTAADGTYLFPNLPASGNDYLVDVTDEGQVLTGHWHSLGTPGADDESQTDLYPVTLGAGNPVDNVTADFGYYIEPGSVGGVVWIDRDNNGIQDLNGDEDPIAGVEVQLMITYPDGTMVTLTDVTDADGAYAFTGLLLDEDFNGPNSGVVYSIKVPSLMAQAQAAFPNEIIIPSVIDAGGDDLIDADDPAGVSAEPTQGLSDATHDLTNPGAEPTHMSYDFAVGAQRVDGAIGNFVYLDENGNGIQDAGEAGIAGVTVNLTGDATATAVTDANGGYIFPNLPEGDYTVTVDESTLPSGMAQTTSPVNPGADMGNQTNGYNITLAAGEENLTGDFGYNFGDATGNTGLAALGNRVWNDADADGVQDAGEAGIGGVTVTIYTDTNGDGVIDPATDMPFTAAVDQNGNTGTGVTTTDPDGTYYFSSLPAGEYAVVVDPASPGLVGKTQSGDPDEPGTPATTPDDMSDPVVLAPGDNYVNLDFGYNDPAGSDIGNTIYADSDADGTQDPDEPGIPGVTVALLDANGDVIATTVTDENGEFIFPGLDDGTYTVVVTDTDNVLDDLENTEDPDGGNDGMSTVVLAGADELDEDFGYTPEGQDVDDGLIGDVVFIDYNQDGLPDPNEGIEGVVVELRDDQGNVIATTTTDENGAYAFPGLDPTETYSVTVDPATLPEGVSPTVDPDGGNDNTATTDLSTTPGGIDLTLDFGYEADTPGSIGSLVWIDSNADGINDGPDGPDGIPGTDDDEPGVEGVKIDLYSDTNGNGVLDAGEPLITSTMTAADGTYSFPNLPADDNDYLVDVTDECQVLTGYWHSLGTPGADDESQTEIYPVTLGGGNPVDNVTADFGYFIESGSVGGVVWIDRDKNGIQDLNVNEEPIPGVEVQLMITYPDGTMVTLTDITDADGAYSFTGLLLDEDYNGPNSGAVYSIKVPNLIADAQLAFPSEVILPSLIDQGIDDFIDADDPAGVTAEPTQGLSDATHNLTAPGSEPTHMSYDFAVLADELMPLDLVAFEAVKEGCKTNLTWITANEVNTSHFNVQKSTDGENYNTLDRVDAAGFSTAQLNYSFVDARLTAQNYYRLEMIDIDGTTTYSKVVYLVGGECSNTISSIFPNPVSDQSLTINFNSYYDGEATNVVVTDVLGRTVMTDQVTTNAGKNVIDLDVSRLAQATYFITLRGENGWFTKSVQFVKLSE